MKRKIRLEKKNLENLKIDMKKLEIKIILREMLEKIVKKTLIKQCYLVELN